MKRRQFIQKSILSAVAMAVPFSKMYGQKLGDFDTFTGTKTNEKTKDEISFEIILYNDLNTKFAEIPVEKKIIKFVAYKKIDGNFKSYKADLKAMSIKMLDNKDGKTDDVYKIETTILQTNSSEFELPKELNIKKMTLLYYPDSDYSVGEKDKVTILDKKNGIYHVLSFKDKSTDEGCFLTTACTIMLGKADDCFELNTLRNFRDQVLKADEEGKSLIKKYYAVAPLIVKAINERENKNEIYNGIYHQMVLPTINHIMNKNKKAAIEVYQNHTKNLETLYL